MNVISTAPIDRDAFLRWNEGREGRRELVNGKVVEMMTGATRGHARLVSRVARALENRLGASGYEVLATDLGVKTPAGVRYPDIVVDGAGGSGMDLAATTPVLIAEVLSPSSRRIDLVDKAADYAGLASLHAYVVLSQVEPRVWVWLRGGASWNGPNEVAGFDGMVEVSTLSLSVALKSLYPPNG